MQPARQCGEAQPARGSERGGRGVGHGLLVVVDGPFDAASVGPSGGRGDGDLPCHGVAGSRRHHHGACSGRCRRRSRSVGRAGCVTQRIGCAFTGRAGAPWRTSARSSASPDSSARAAAARGTDRRRTLVVAREPARDGEVVEDVEQVFLAALVGRAVALDQAAALGDLGAERGVAARRRSRRRRASVRSPPARRRSGCRARRSTRIAASARRRRKPNTRVGADLERQRERLVAARDARLRSQRTSAAARRCGSSPANSATPGLKWSTIAITSPRPALTSRSIAREARRARLQVGDADDVVERHPEREPARRGERRRVAVRDGRIAGLLGGQHPAETLEVEIGVTSILVVDEAGVAERDQLAHLGREGGDRAGRRSGPRGASLRAPAPRLPRRPPHRLRGARRAGRDDVERRREPAQAGGGTLVGLADRLLARRARQRQHAARRDGAEQHGADHGAALACDLGHVEHLRLAAVFAHQRQQVGARRAAVAERHLLGGRQAAAGRAEDVGTLARRHAGADLACGLEQLGRREQVERAGDRVQAEDRLLAAKLGVGNRERPRRSRWSRRCAGRRRESTCSARCGPSARRCRPATRRARRRLRRRAR